MVDYPYGSYDPMADYPYVYDDESDGPSGMPTGLVSTFNCQNPEYLLEATCVVEYPEYIGDGWCDWNLGGDDWFGSSHHHNVEACGYDGGDCCRTTCQGALCGQNGYHCQDPNATTTTASLYPNDYPGEEESPSVGGSEETTSGGSSSVPPTPSTGAPTAAAASSEDEATFYPNDYPGEDYPNVDGSEETTSGGSSPAPPTPSTGAPTASPGARARALADDAGSQTLYAALEDIVATACADEMARCFEDKSGACGRLFLVGSASLASDTLQDLLKCIRDFDGDGVLPTSYLDGMNEEQGECIAQNCRAEYMECHVSMDCFLGTKTNALRQRLDECAQFCTFTPMPTVSPTLRPTAGGGDDAIGFIIEADGKQFRMEYKQITAGNLGTIPLGSPLEGEILVSTSCDPSIDGSVDLGGMFVIIKRGLCNVHYAARVVFEGGARLVAFADDAAASRFPTNISVSVFPHFRISAFPHFSISVFQYFSILPSPTSFLDFLPSLPPHPAYGFPGTNTWICLYCQ
jgi:hypothetical protein